jgi:hypothetical protein
MMRHSVTWRRDSGILFANRNPRESCHPKPKASKAAAAKINASLNNAKHQSAAE